MQRISLSDDTDKFFSHRMRLKPRIALEVSSSNADLSSQYLCGTAKPDSQHVVCEILVMDARGRWKTVRALIDCGATSVFVSPRLVERLGIEDQMKPAFTTTRGIDGKILVDARDSQKVDLNVQYLSYLAPTMEKDCLIVPMQAYDVVLGIPWFKARNPDIDWLHGCLLCLRTPGGDTRRGNAVFRKAADGFTSLSTQRGEMLFDDALPARPDEATGDDRDRAAKIEMLSATSMGELLGEEDSADTYILKLCGLHDKGLRMDLSGIAVGDGTVKGSFKLI